MGRHALVTIVIAALVAVCACDRLAVTPCASIRARFNEAHAKRTDTCSTNSDCACFNPVGGPQLGCGGVTDAATSKKLDAIEAEFHAASCPWTHQCPASACMPKCVSGRCAS
jgi:hypothetical protein